MPTYDYACAACGHRMEVVHGVHGHGPKVCPACGNEGTMRKLIVAPAIHFKGSGWAKKDRSATAVPGKGKTAKPAEEKVEAKATPAPTDAPSSGSAGD